MNQRQYWVETLDKIIKPVLSHLANNSLVSTMPLGGKDAQNEVKRECHGLEAFGRIMTGLSPWLVAKGLDESEAKLQASYLALVKQGLKNATDKTCPDYLGFNTTRQHLVDAAFLAHGLLRTHKTLWPKLSPTLQSNVIDALKRSRSIRPHENNWLLFSAMIESFLHAVDGGHDPMRIDYAVKQHEQWYKGDGAYGDGKDFHWDYYNSYVIQPMLLDIVENEHALDGSYDNILEPCRSRALRFAEVQERMISPEGTFPPIGRSLCYRMGAFQHLAQMAYKETLPQTISPAQVRCALTAVMERVMKPKNTFDANGWLTAGLAGSQPSLGESYIGTGSTYLCCAVFLPLGLSPASAFWSDEDENWTAKKIFAGEDVETDKALKK